MTTTPIIVSQSVAPSGSKLSLQDFVQACENFPQLAEITACVLDVPPSEVKKVIARGEVVVSDLVGKLNSYFLSKTSVFKSALDEWFEKTEWLRKTITPQELGKHYADVLRERIEKLEKENAELKAAKLPQQEGADYFVVLNNDGDVEFAYNAQLGRDFGHDHIKNCQERDIPVSRWVVRPAFATQPAAQGMDAIRALIAQHSKELEHNHYAYFELAYTRQTGWMAWITDHPRSMPPTKVANPDRKVLASGQGDTPDAACADALAVTQPAAQATRQWPEKLGETCMDEGTCHHGCTDRCFRRECCAPLTMAMNEGLTMEQWRYPDYEVKKALEKANYASHDLYETGDPGAPDVIKDWNDQVVLGLCKRCGRGEAELAEPCTPKLKGGA